MKKITTITCLLFSCAIAKAQYVKQPFALKENAKTNSRIVTGNIADINVIAGSMKNLAKTTGAVIVTDDLGSGTSTTLPTGWSTSGNPAASWKWRNGACTGVYNIGTINSTSAANGWLVYDSDSIGALSNATALDGWVAKKWTIPAGHAHVGMTFQEWFRSFNDLCYVEVSTDSVNWTQYAISANNSLAGNTNLPSNPYTVSVNLSTLASGTTTFYTRFRYIYSGPAGGGYNWLVDDLSVVDVDSIDMKMGGSLVLGNWGGFDASSAFSALPLALADTLVPVTLASNKGFTGLTSTITATIYKGATSVYTNTLTRSLPVGADDSVFDFPGYKPTTTGNYTVTFSNTTNGDATPLNNLDTVRFTISDTIYSQNSGNLNGYYYIHKPAGTTAERSSSTGTRFDIPATETARMSGVSVAFDASTTVGSKVGFQIYSLTTNGWDIVSISDVKTLTAADISTSGNVVYSYFPVSSNTAATDNDLTANTYAAIIVGDNVPDTSTVAILTSPSPNATVFAGYFGQTDTSLNSLGTSSFGADLLTGLSSVPAVRLHFKSLPVFPSSVIEVNSGNIAMSAYPNPATNVLNISYKQETAATVNIKLVNTIGQIVDSKTASNVTTGALSFNVTSLPAGVYLYTAEVNGKLSTQRVVIAH